MFYLSFHPPLDTFKCSEFQLKVRKESSSLSSYSGYCAIKILLRINNDFMGVVNYHKA